MYPLNKFSENGVSWPFNISGLNDQNLEKHLKKNKLKKYIKIFGAECLGLICTVSTPKVPKFW